MSERRDPRKFFSDLYKDLEDRRLLLPAIALLVAIVAVPLLLKSSPPPAPPAAVPPASEESNAVEAAVLASDAGVRNYRERLEQLKEKNPFTQQFVSSGGGSTDDGTETTASTDTGAATGTDGFPVGEEITGGGTTPTDTAPTDPGTPAGTEPETVTETETITETKEVTRLVTRRIDVEVGPQGDVKERRNVRDLTLLPSKQKPVVAFLGATEDAKRATFALSADVTSTGGSGSCVGGGPLACEFLTLKIGQQQSFEYVDGQTYKLKLLAVEDVEVKTEEQQAE